MPSPITLNLAGDCDVFDGTASVSLTDPFSGAVTTSDTALKRELADKEVEKSNGRYKAGDVRWHIPQAEVATKPNLGATITDGNGDAWTVLEVTDSTLRSRWGCVSRRLEIAGGLDSTVTIQSLTIAKGTYGEAVETWSTYLAGVSARVQVLSESMQIEHNRRLTSANAVVYFAQNYDLTENHRILYDGKTYSVLRAENKETLDRLYAVYCRLDPFPF